MLALEFYNQHNILSVVLKDGILDLHKTFIRYFFVENGMSVSLFFKHFNQWCLKKSVVAPELQAVSHVLHQNRKENLLSQHVAEVFQAYQPLYREEVDRSDHEIERKGVLFLKKHVWPKIFHQ